MVSVPCSKIYLLKDLPRFRANGNNADRDRPAFVRFLLKYVSRDEVSLLGRGTGGVPDVRTAIEGYEEKSPLYGFLQYRRRKVVLKYVPDGISRLLQGERQYFDGGMQGRHVRNAKRHFHIQYHC
jgi:hypothetical protein